MRRITLAGTGIETSALGFGCAQLATYSPVDPPEKLLSAAFEAGVSHFDVARAYGRGECEAILGRFLQGKRDKVTITTKFGIFPQSSAAAAISKVARKVLQPFGKGAVEAVTHRLQRRHAFTPQDLRASFEASLRALGTDYVDLLLLHEAHLEDLNDGLMAALRKLQQEGKIRAFGLGSVADETERILNQRPEFAPVVQFPDGLANRNANRLRSAGAKAMLTHGLLNSFGNVRDRIASLGDPAELLLRYAQAKNPYGVVLFSTRSSERIRTNVEAASKGPLPVAEVDALERAV